LDWAGPLWIGELWNRDYVSAMVQELPNIEHQRETEKLLKTIEVESKVQTVGFYTISALGKAFKLPKLPTKKQLLKELDAVETHFTGEGFRTLKPHEEVVEKVKQLVES
jgi:tRNA (guanine26-N2/guanine27-N2)-dimethyltransferase